MPEIQAKPGDWVDLTLKLTALLINPDGSDVEDMLGRALEPQMRATVDKAFPDALPPPTREEYAMAAAADPDGLTLNLKTHDFLAGILIGGLTLEYALRLAEHAPRVVSLNKAFELVERDLMEQGLQSSRTFVKKCWQRLRPFSHFVCAHVRNPERVARSFALIGGLPTISQPAKKQTAFGISESGFIDLINKFKDDPESFGTQLRAEIESLFAEAEALRRIGERRYGRGQKVHGRPFLDPETTWSVPSGFNLPDVKLEFAPLTKDEIAILNGVK